MPTGGVICAISTTSTIKMPNQMGSIPAACTAGRMTDVVSTTMEMPSRKHPRMMNSSVRTAISAAWENCLATIHSASIAGSPVKLMAVVR